jgi:hypothetical protein
MRGTHPLQTTHAPPDTTDQVDNTFVPLAVSPTDHGADVVVHSLTKFINGASDFIAGAVCGTTEFVGSLMDLHNGPLMLLGPTMDPQVATFEYYLSKPTCVRAWARFYGGMCSTSLPPTSKPTGSDT